MDINRIFEYDVKETESGLKTQQSIDTRSMIGSKFKKNYMNISIGFNQSSNDFKKAKNYAEAKCNHEAYKILLTIYQNLKAKIN